MALTPEERQALGLRLMAMQRALRDVCDSVDVQAKLCVEAGEKGMAFASHMLRDAIAAYSLEMARCVKKFIAEHDVDR